VPLVVSHRGHPEVERLAHHTVMGAMTMPLLELAGVRSVALPDGGTGAVEELAERARAAGEPYAVVVRRGDLTAPGDQAASGDQAGDGTAEPGRTGPDDPAGGGPRPPGELLGAGDRAAVPARRGAVLEALLDRRPAGTVAVASTGHISRALYAIADDDRNAYLSGSMGYASAFGLGVSLHRPDLGVLVVEGDGSALMHLGGMTTIGALAGGNVRHVVLDNRVHGSTGGQPTASATVDFPALAASVGYRSAAGSGAFGSVAAAVDWLFSAPAPALLHVPIVAEDGDGLPRIAVGLDEQVARLSSWAAGPVP
jgi:phosphonopyruvate decarboxylase